MILNIAPEVIAHPLPHGRGSVSGAARRYWTQRNSSNPPVAGKQPPRARLFDSRIAHPVSLRCVHSSGISRKEFAKRSAKLAAGAAALTPGAIRAANEH